MKTKTILNTLLFLLGGAVIVFFITFPVCRERDTFNKFKDPNTPSATFVDALFSDLRVTTK